MAKNDFFIGALIGVAAGATLGILFAPEKGRVVRQKVASGDYLFNLKVKYNHVIDTLTTKLDSAAAQHTDFSSLNTSAQKPMHKISNS